MPTKKIRTSIQFDNPQLKEGVDRFIVDKKIKSLSALINQLLTELLINEGYYEPPKPPRLLK